MHSSLRIIYFLFLVSIIHLSCTKDNDNPHTQEYISTPFYLQCFVEPPSDFRYPLNVEIGETDLNSNIVLWKNKVDSNYFGSYLITGLYSSNILIGHGQYIFSGFQFWSEDLPSDRKWTKTELEDFFQIGTTFEVGKGPSKVDIQLRIANDLGNSKSSYLLYPSGFLTITDIEDFDYLSIALNHEPLEHFGKRITCVFECKIGGFEPHLIIDDDNPQNPFYSDEVIEVTEGEAVFFVDY